MKGNNNKSHQFFPLTAIEKFIHRVPMPNRIYLCICRPLFIQNFIKCFFRKVFFFIYNVEYFICLKRTRIEASRVGNRR